MNNIDMGKIENLINKLDTNKEMKLKTTSEDQLKQLEEIEENINKQLADIYVKN